MFLQVFRAFLVGGLFCMIVQILLDKTSLTPARILVSLVVTGVILGGLGLYEPIVDFAGAGANVPLCGFGNLIAKGVRKAVDENGWIGALIGGLSSSSAGICAALIFSFVAAIFCKGHARK